MNKKNIFLILSVIIIFSLILILILVINNQNNDKINLEPDSKNNNLISEQELSWNDYSEEIILREEFHDDLSNQLWYKYTKIVEKQERSKELFFELEKKYDLENESSLLKDVISNNKYSNHINNYIYDDNIEYKDQFLKSIYIEVQKDYPSFTYLVDIWKFENIISDEKTKKILDIQSETEDTTLPNWMIVTPEINKTVMDELELMSDSYPNMSDEDLSELIFYDLLKNNNDLDNDCYSIDDSIKQLECLEDKEKLSQPSF